MIICLPLEICTFFFVGVFISLKPLRGPLARVKEENPLLFRKFTAECQKLGFPEIIRPCKFWIVLMYVHIHVCMCMYI